ncbi:MAG: hypothetical protein JST19_08705 [Bacteroidetes bacterium]|nr:hypothetical protein [Bacteroidota bacterium]
MCSVNNPAQINRIAEILKNEIDGRQICIDKIAVLPYEDALLYGESINSVFNDCKPIFVGKKLTPGGFSLLSGV